MWLAKEEQGKLWLVKKETAEWERPHEDTADFTDLLLCFS